MKSIKYLALAAAALLATACSSNDDKDFSYNTAEGITVQMEDATYETMENQGVFVVPVTVTGESNGYITITVECTETGENPAIANRNYYLTSDRINIPAGAKTAEIEFRAQDFRGADPDREFNVTIVSAQGAAIGALKTTTVTILDKGSSPTYEELPGTYLLQTTLPDSETGEFTEENVSQVKMQLGKSDGHGGGTVVVSGVLGQFNMEFVYEYDEEEKYGELVFNYNCEAIANSGYDQVIWTPIGGSLTGQPVRGQWNATYTSVKFGDSSSTFAVSVFNPSYLGTIDAMSAFTLIRVPVAE